MTVNPSAPSPSPFGPWFGSDSSSDAEEDFDLTLPAPRTSSASPSQTIKALLQSGREQLGVELGFLARIEPGPGTHTVTVRSGSHPILSEGVEHDLADTYCREVVISSPLALYDAPQQGWAEDPAYQRFGLDTYLGTKIVVDNHLYGTVCFADPTSRTVPFSETEYAALKRLGTTIEDVLTPSPGMVSRATQQEDRNLCRRIQEVSQVGGWELHLETSELVWTEQTYRLHDLPTTYEPDLESALDFYPPEVRPTLRSAIHDCIERGLPFDETLPLVTAGGIQRYVRTRGQPYRKNGSITRITGTIQDVTEKTEMHHTLREERDLLNRVVETSPSAIAIFDRDGQFVRVSDRANEILGLEKAEVTDRSYNDPDWDITTPDGDPLPDDELPFARVKETGEPVEAVKHTIEWPDGSRRILSVSGAPLFGDDDKFMGAVFHIDDVTDRWEAELSLRESEERFRGVFENAAIGIALIDEDGLILEANPALKAMFGVEDRSPGADGPYVNTFLDTGEPGPNHSLSQVLAGERDYCQFERRCVRENGDVFWARVSVSRTDSPGEGQIIGMVEDIDRRKRQKEELRLFRTAVEDANEAILLLEGTPRSKPGPPIAYANPAFTCLSGYDSEEIIGHPLEFLWGPDTNEQVLQDFWNALEAGRRHEGETIAYRNDGTPFINRWSIAPLRNTEGTITHWISVQRDVTARRETDKRLLEVQDEERRRIDQELHDELGGLLTSLQLTVELARMNTDEGSSPIEHLDEIEEHVENVASATRTISRRLHPDVLDQEGLTSAVPALLQSLQEKHGTEIRCTCDVGAEATLASSIEMVTYQVVQEALLCALHQFSASALSVALRTENRTLYAVVVCQDAHLPDPADEATDCKRLHRMSEWVHRFDGEFTVSHEAETDTRIQATLPLTVAPLPD